MSEIGENLKSFLKKGIEVIGNKASDLASNAKQKVGEYNLANEKKDLFSAIGSKIYDNYLNGDTVPEGLEEELTRITEIDQELEAIRAEKEKAGESAEGDAGEPGERVQTEEEVSAEEPAAAEYAAKDDSDVPVIEIEEDGTVHIAAVEGPSGEAAKAAGIPVGNSKIIPEQIVFLINYNGALEAGDCFGVSAVGSEEDCLII